MALYIQGKHSTDLITSSSSVGYNVNKAAAAEAASSYTTSSSNIRQSYVPPFHPSLHSTKSNTVNLKPLQMTPAQSTFIADTMKELKERAAKRQKMTTISTTTTMVLNNNSFSMITENGILKKRFDFLDEFDAHPDIIQLVATSGGLITHWNEAYTKLTKRSSTSLQRLPMTIFELVDCKSLSLLYSMLALSLHNIGIVEVEDFALMNQGEERRAEMEQVVSAERSPASHLSITLPCKAFRDTATRYNITVVFMNDLPSMKRSFVGIITPRAAARASSASSSSSSASSTTSDYRDDYSLGSLLSISLNNDNNNAQDVMTRASLPIGKILRMTDDMLCQILLGSSSTK